MYEPARDNDMSHVKSANTLRAELAAGKPPRGVYGDTRGGRTFEGTPLDTLRWSEVWAGPGCTLWTICAV